jgi:tetratricopeptide (TPR) repeat protein
MNFELILETQPKEDIVRLRLLDQHGVQLAASLVELRKQSPAMWEALFDTRGYVERYAGALLDDSEGQPRTEGQILDEIGLFLGETVLGPDIMGCLSGNQHRTLLIRLPDTANDPLAAALARVPWEIARARADEPPLLERNLVVRAVTDDTAALVPEGGDAGPLRVLLVFAEAPGSRPLAMREERETLLRLFFDEVLPDRRVEVDVLCHGVTRARLTDQITAHGGYQIIHWSGHGGHNLLELHGQDGKPDYLSGGDLVKLIHDAGGFIPRLMFLSACLSGTFVNVKNWEEFQAAMAGKMAGHKQAGDGKFPDPLASKAGYTGTALELLRAGVPQVVAMRYEVGDDYARDLAEHFYKHLLVDPVGHSVETALSLSRGEVARDPDGSRGYQPIDHATPLVFGRSQIAFQPKAERSAQHGHRRPQPQPLLPGGSRELDLPANFVGRGNELTRLAGHWLPRNQPAVALVQGLAGLGKTVLAAEGIHLWHQRFDLVFAFQTKAVPLSPEEFYRQLDLKLVLNSATYRKTREQSPNRAVHLPTTGPLTGAARFEQMRVNLVEALRNENVLLVLDNFETNLESVAGPQGYRCQDPEWDRLLAELAAQLPPTASRALVTSRHRLAALADPKKALWLPLGPLPMGEAALYVRSHESLRRLYYRDATGQALAMRLLQVSRGHPLILDRLASLADDETALTQALDRLQSVGGWQALPDVFAGARSEAERENERKYLEDVAIGAVDLLIQRASPEARRLLWMVTLANEPVPPALVEGIWAGKSVVLAVRPLLEELHGAGLLSREAAGLSEQRPYGFHELVRERITHWMTAHAAETGGRTREEIWRAYGERYVAVFDQQSSSGQKGAMERATEAGRRALTYLARARAFDQLDGFASEMVTGTRDPTTLRSAIEELRAVVEQAPPGRPRWSMRTNLADALRRAGQADEALPFYQQAAAEAESAADWPDVAVICQNWASALRSTGDLSQAKATYLRSVKAEKKAGGPRVNILMSELEALRIDVMQGQAAAALPGIARRLNEVGGWWKRHRAGESVPEAPDPVLLGRVLVSGLNVACQANLALKRWQACLDLLRETEQTKRDLGQSELELARTRFNQYRPLIDLDHLDDAQEVVESCLAVFRAGEAVLEQSSALSALASVWDKRGETGQAAALARQALALRNQLPDPTDRAMSHGNLASYLEKAGQQAPAAGHELAAAIYFLISGYEQHLATWRSNLAVGMRRADRDGRRHELPRLSALLADPEFDALKQFLTSRGVDLAQLQSALDQLVEQVRQQAAS